VVTVDTSEHLPCAVEVTGYSRSCKSSSATAGSGGQRRRGGERVFLVSGRHLDLPWWRGAADRLTWGIVEEVHMAANKAFARLCHWSRAEMGRTGRQHRGGEVSGQRLACMRSCGILPRVKPRAAYLPCVDRLFWARDKFFQNALGYRIS
jgi:hypothetical protein